jgi:hypothetical protein
MQSSMADERADNGAPAHGHEDAIHFVASNRQWTGADMADEAWSHCRHRCIYSGNQSFALIGNIRLTAH